jgi:hypothetical protein
VSLLLCIHIIFHLIGVCILQSAVGSKDSPYLLLGYHYHRCSGLTSRDKVAGPSTVVSSAKRTVEMALVGITIAMTNHHVRQVHLDYLNITDDL